jgi:ABC-2 type transport system ATP-binding protein
MQEVLKITNLSKSYGRIKAVRDLSLTVFEGQVLGLLGPNGSGKTTTLSMILDVVKADTGEYEWFGGVPVTIARKRIGTLLEKPNFYPYLSAMKNLEITCRIKEKGGNRIEDVLKQVGLFQRRNSTVKGFSTGMKQRLAIAASLVSDPDVLILDEPTNGLDPSGIADIRSLIHDIASNGKTIVLASHLLDEVEKVCTDVAVMKNGKLLELRKLKNSVEEGLRVIEIAVEGDTDLQKLLEKMDGIKVVQSLNSLWVVESKKSPREINRVFAEKGIYLTHLRERRKTLEEQFLELTNQ